MDRSGITLPRPNAREALLRACPDYRRREYPEQGVSRVTGASEGEGSICLNGNNG